MSSTDPGTGKVMLTSLTLVLRQKHRVVTPVTPKKQDQPYTPVSGWDDCAEVPMSAKKIIIGLVLLAIAATVPTAGAFANAPGGAYIQCNGSASSPVRCAPDSW